MMYCVKGQHRLQTGWLPQANYTRTINSLYTYTLRGETRFGFHDYLKGTPEPMDPQWLLTDLNALMLRKINQEHSFTLGYLIRFQPGTELHRIIFQYFYVESYRNFRAAHRFIADRGLEHREMPVTRFRYRLSLEKPLDGEQVDPGEAYLKLNNEYLMAIQNGHLNHEYRLTLAMGYLFSKEQRMEITLEERINALEKPRHRKQFWLGMAWYYQR